MQEKQLVLRKSMNKKELYSLCSKLIEEGNFLQFQLSESEIDVICFARSLRYVLSNFSPNNRVPIAVEEEQEQNNNEEEVMFG